MLPDKPDDEQIICLWCSQLTNIIWIHGHGQCAVCGTNIDECCRGEHCNTLTEKESSGEENTN
jgi:hypothetical protein